MQLSHNAPPLLEIGDEIDPVRIAMREYDAGILPIYVVRRFPDGSIQTVYPTLDTI
jgi:DNA-directed RNA polymerase subunit K/omega